jgi:hypothetical protein
LSVPVRIVADDALDPGMARVAHEGLQAERVSWCIIDEGGQLPRQDRRDQQHQKRERHDKAAENKNCGQQPADAALAQLIGQRIEQARTAGSQSSATKTASAATQNTMLRSNRMAPQCPAPNEFMCRTHSAR